MVSESQQPLITVEIRQTDLNDVSKTRKRQRKCQRNEHLCLVCQRIISRGNFSSRERHANACHKDDPDYDVMVDIVKHGSGKAGKKLIVKSHITQKKQYKKCKQEYIDIEIISGNASKTEDLCVSEPTNAKLQGDLPHSCQEKSSCLTQLSLTTKQKSSYLLESSSKHATVKKRKGVLLHIEDQGSANKKPVKRKRLSQRNEHICLVCRRVISRGNLSSRQRHAKYCHKDDPDYDCMTHMVKHDSIIGDDGDVQHIPDKHPSQTKHQKRKLPTADKENIHSCVSESGQKSEKHNRQGKRCRKSVKSHAAVKNSEAPLPVLKQSSCTIMDELDKGCNASSTVREIKQLESVSLPATPMVVEKEIECMADAELFAVQVALKRAKCFKQLNELVFEYFSNEEGHGLLRCNLCFEKVCQTNPDLKDQDPFRVLGYLQKTEMSVGNTLASGIIIKKEKLNSLVAGRNSSWYSFKCMLMEHVSKSSRSGGIPHFQAQLWKTRQGFGSGKQVDGIANQLNCALMTVKRKANGACYKALLGLLLASGLRGEDFKEADIQMRHMLLALHHYINVKTKQLLMHALPSTGLPPHFSTSSDISCVLPADIAPLLITVTFHGRKVVLPILTTVPVDNNRTDKSAGAVSAQLAENVVRNLMDTTQLPPDCLSFLVCHYANCQLKSPKFDNVVKAHIEKNSGFSKTVFPVHHETFFLTPWEVSQWVDNCVALVCQKEGSHFFQRFLKRANEFFENFTGCAGGKARYDRAEHLKSRHILSLLQQCQIIYSNFSHWRSRLDKLNEVGDGDRKKNLVLERDFCLDLCGVFDCLAPLAGMINKVQSADCFLWSVTKWWPKLHRTLSEMKKNLGEQLNAGTRLVLKPDLFPKLSAHFQDLSAENVSSCKFQNVPLVESYEVEKVEDFPVAKAAPRVRQIRTRKTVVNWKKRCFADCLAELKDVTSFVLERLQKRFQCSVPIAANILGNCFHLPDLLRLMTGAADESLQKTSADLYGIDSFLLFYTYVCSLPQVVKLAEAKPNLNLSSDCCHDVLKSFKSAVFKVIWNDLGGCRKEWFTVVEGSFIDAELTKFEMVDEGADLRSMYKFTFGSHVCCARLTESSAFASFYTNVAVYTEAGQEFCIALDVALAMCGAPAEVESYCSVLKAHASALNDSPQDVVLKTNVDWHFPNPDECQETVREAASLYFFENQGGNFLDASPANAELVDNAEHEEEYVLLPVNET